MTQGNMSIAGYYTKLKKLWDEFASLDPLPPSSCGTSKKLKDQTAPNQLMQFLLGLSDAYDHVSNQVLLMDPLPTAAKAYSMFLRVEKQREIQSGISGLDGEGVMATQSGDLGRQMPDKGTAKREDLLTKGSCYDYCKNTVGCKWIYKTKLKPDGSTERYKERLVAKGFSQVEGIDYNDCFASVAKAITVSHGHCLFTKGVGPQFVALLVYVDDILVTESTDELIQEVKRDTGMHKGKTVITPLPPGLKLSTDLGGALPDLSKYKRIIGKLLYLGFTRPDICHATQQLSHLPDYKNITNEILHILGFKPSLLENKETDSCVKVLYRSRIRSMTATVCEITWVIYLLKDLGVEVSIPVPFFYDNKAALHITANPLPNTANPVIP
ncbi:hypothetical protein Sango_0654800 [Sesamum angolense]|uniref:Reverse transcriptase Ty1/copia-type domain-containing protein n=1 Tax=Sesamum angolense TaxID=2727404 RepID=A0AAE1X7Y5_9LAMI|nr:hypothetical protein Sango_0654800 [Sesamum angolense]